MPNGDNWQGDVLRDLRAASATPEPRNEAHEPHGPQQPGPQAAAQGHPQPAWGGAPGYGYPQGPGQGEAPGHGYPQPGAARAGTPGPQQGQVHPAQQPAPGAPQQGHQQPAAAQAPGYGYPQTPGQAEAAGYGYPQAAQPQAQAQTQGYGYPRSGAAQGGGAAQARPEVQGTAQPYAPDQPSPAQEAGPLHVAGAAHAAATAGGGAQGHAQHPPAAQVGQAHAHAHAHAQAQAQAHAQAQAAAPAAAPRQRSAVRTPESLPVIDKSLVGAYKGARRGEPFLTRAARTLWRTVSSSASREVADATRTAELLQQPVTTGRQIAVTSIRGGAGKSTVAALLGTTYAHYRQDPVLFVEADPALGSLPIRLGADTLRWTTGEVADIVEPQMSLLDVTGYLVQLRDNAWLLPGSQGRIGAMLDLRSYERAMVALRRYFGVTVVDCETLPAEVARVALSASQARVLATPAALDGIASTHAVLQWMQGLPPHLIAGTVVVITEQSPHSGIDLEEAARTLASTGAGVHVLPYDRHLASGGVIRTELLAESTRTIATRLAADVFQLSQKRH
ncbi:MinD/ParA family ATP-binding protein [Streptomyces sp. NPDC004244]